MKKCCAGSDLTVTEDGQHTSSPRVKPKIVITLPRRPSSFLPVVQIHGRFGSLLNSPLLLDCAILLEKITGFF